MLLLLWSGKEVLKLNIRYLYIDVMKENFLFVNQFKF
jgi:hypothetical protein